MSREFLGKFSTTRFHQSLMILIVIGLEMGFYILTMCQFRLDLTGCY